MSKQEQNAITLAVVVNYNTGEWLEACIDSLLSSTYPVRICIVDNASTDSSVDRISNRLHASTGIELVRNKENVGFTRANNQALQNDPAEFFVLINPDCVVETDTIGKVVAARKHHRDIGLASCLIKNADGTIQKTCRRKFPTPWSGMVRTLGINSLFPERFEDFDYGDKELTEELEYVEAVSGAFMVARGSAVETVGYLDEGYFMHCEDLDWCKRFWDAGFKVAFVPDAFVTHKKGASGRSLRVNWYLHQGMLRFYKKFYIDEYPKIFFGLVYLGVFLSFLAKSTLILLRGQRASAGHS